MTQDDTMSAIEDKPVAWIGKGDIPFLSEGPYQRLGAAISRNDWSEVIQAHAIIRDTLDAARAFSDKLGREG